MIDFDARRDDAKFLLTLLACIVSLCAFGWLLSWLELL